MSKSVAVIDYGVGNLLSVSRALAHCGATAVVTSDAAELSRADALILPGVGAFAGGMQGLRERGLIEPLREYARGGRPFLGICLGMQLMFELGREHGEHAGLGLMAGSVEAIPASAQRKIPHIGWAELRAPGGRADWRGSMLEGAKPGTSAVYFVHSYHAVPSDPADLLAVCDYAGFAVTAAVGRGNLQGCQFHPEKSGTAGLGIMRGFLAMA